MNIENMELHAGDTVRVVLEGVTGYVTDRGKGGLFQLLGEGGYSNLFIAPKSPNVKSVEVLSRKFREGDEVVLSEVSDQLPTGTQVGRRGNRLVKLLSGHWISLDSGYTYGADTLPAVRTISYLPDSE